MDELLRLKLRRKRRQEAFEALAKIDDATQALRLGCQAISEAAQDLKARRVYFLLHPFRAFKRIATASNHAALVSELEAIESRVSELRNEFSNLQHSDEREMKELKAILPR